jgi:hypothetical protein
MARLTDSEGHLLGGLHPSRGELSLAEFLPSLKGTGTSEYDLVSPPSAAVGTDEVVSGLECSYGSFIYLTYSYGVANPAAGVRQPQAHARDWGRLIEQPQARYHCALCHGDYCATHAKPTAHDCSAIIAIGNRVP